MDDKSNEIRKMSTCHKCDGMNEIKWAVISMVSISAQWAERT